MGGGVGNGGPRAAGGNIWWQQHQAHLHLQAKQGTPLAHIRQSPDPSSGSPSPRVMYPPFGPAPGGARSGAGAPQALSLALSDFPSLPSRTTGPGPSPHNQQSSHHWQQQSQQQHQQQQLFQLQQQASLSGNQIESRASLSSGTGAGGTPLAGPVPAVNVPAPQGAWSQGPGFRWGAEGAGVGQHKQPDQSLLRNPQQQQQQYQQHQQQYQQQLQNQPLIQQPSGQPIANAKPPSPQPGATPGSGPAPNGATAAGGGAGGGSGEGNGGTTESAAGAPGQAAGPFGFTSFFSPASENKDAQPQGTTHMSLVTSHKPQVDGVAPGGHGAGRGDATASLAQQISQLQISQLRQQQQHMQQQQSAGQAEQHEGQVPLLNVGQSAGGGAGALGPAHGWAETGALKDSQLCVCCALRPVLFRNYPCEHEAVCHVCCKTVANCPICGAARASAPSSSAPSPSTPMTVSAGAPGVAPGVGSGAPGGDS